MSERYALAPEAIEDPHGWHRSIASPRSRLCGSALPGTHGVAGEMIEFEVTIRPVKALMALAEETGNRIGPELAQLKPAAGG